ncbi:MAG: hypothetical protein ACYCZJ_11585 [Sulfuriferula sp.]
MDKAAVRQAVTLDPAWVAELRVQWTALMEMAVWGEVKSSRMGAATRMRKRLLDVGEKLRSLAADRDWIPHPREQVKNALGSAFSLKDALLQFERAAQDMDGGTDCAVFGARAVQLHQSLLARLPELENTWAALLDSQYLDEDTDD